MRKVMVVLGLAAALLALQACGSESSDGSAAGGDGGGGASVPAPGDLEGRTFVASSAEGYDLVADSEIRLTFEGERLGANAGCNQSSGGYVIEEGVLRWDGTAATTQMACTDELMAQDAWLSAILETGAEVALDGELLTLSTEDVTIELAEEVAAGAAPIVGTRWVLESIVDGDAMSSLPTDVEAPTLEIAADGTAAVFAGCNRGSGGFVVADDEASATVGPLAITKMACEGPASGVEGSVLSVLDGEVELALDGDQLTITNGEAGLAYRAG